MASSAVRFVVRTVIAVALIAGIATGALWSWQRHILLAPGLHEDDVFVLVEPGDGHTVIRWELYRAGVVQHLYHYDIAQFFAGDSYLPKAGEYQIPARASLNETLQIIDSGRSYQRRLTVIEGMRASEVMDILAALPMLKGEFTEPPEEGRILPETYFFTHGTARQTLLDRMVAKREIELTEAWLERDADLPISSADEALILASVVELETWNSAERREVAGFCLNRLRRGMRVQSDPTVRYGVTS